MALSGDASIQEKMRLGEVVDIWYYGSKTLEKQAIPAVQDTRFYQALPNLRQGSSTFIISPDQGLQDIIVGFKLPAQGYDGLAVARGWGYRLINKISVRYGGSSQYFWTGTQVLVENLRECSNPSSRDMLFQLGGAEMIKPADFDGDNLYAYVPLNLPHSSPNGSLEKPNPLPTELLNQPVVITLELNAISSIFQEAEVAVTGGNDTPPSQLEDGWFQVRQIHAHDAGALMRPMGAGAGYSFPLKSFYQNEIQVQLQSSAASQSVVLTGFRAGDVRSIFFWIEDTSDALNPYNWVLPRDVQLLYNGTVYQNYKGTSSQIWDLMGSDVPSMVLNSVITETGNTDPDLAFSSEAKYTQWVNMPFSQVYEQLSGSHLMVRGKMIENAVVNLQLTTPEAKSSYVLHVVYSYNALLFMSAGSSEYVF